MQFTYALTICLYKNFQITNSIRSLITINIPNAAFIFLFYVIKNTSIRVANFSKEIKNASRL
jgi:hypothetical protein